MLAVLDQRVFPSRLKELLVNNLELFLVKCQQAGEIILP